MRKTALLLLASINLLTACHGTTVTTQANAQSSDAVTAKPTATSSVPISSPSTSAQSQREVDDIVRSALASEYGNQAAPALHCFVTHYEGDNGNDGGEYCMHPGKAHLLGKVGERRIFVNAWNEPLYKGGYYKLAPGLMGAFVIGLDGPIRGKVLAARAKIPLGLAGACGCENIELIRLGTNTWGWLYDEKTGDLSETPRTFYYLTAFIGGQLIDLFEAPPPSTVGNESLRFTPGTATGGNGLYVVKAEKLSADGRRLEAWNMRFDPRRNTYVKSSS